MPAHVQIRIRSIYPWPDWIQCVSISFGPLVHHAGCLKPAVMLDTKQAKEAQEPSTVEKCKNSSTRNGMLFLEKVSRIDIKVSVRPIRAGC